MPSASTCSRAALTGPAYSIAAAFRILVCLMIVVALPAQAVSASVERLWNAAHVHVSRPGDDIQPNARQSVPAFPLQAAEHFPMQRLRDIAEGRHPGRSEFVADEEVVHLLAHTQQHHAGTPHHHDSDTQDVVYVAEDGGAQPATPQRSGTHDHDGFTPALTANRTDLDSRPGHIVLEVATTLSVSHSSDPGDRPPQ